MHRFIALQEQRSCAGDPIRPGDFVPDLEKAPRNIQMSNVNICMAHDLSGVVKLDPDDRIRVRHFMALRSDIESATGVSFVELEAAYRDHTDQVAPPEPTKLAVVPPVPATAKVRKARGASAKAAKKAPKQ